MKKVLLIVLVLGMVTCICACKNDEKVNTETVESVVKKEKENTIFEDFSCETNQGTIYQLYDRKDKKPVFINFWATWCGPCVGEMPELQDIYNEYKDKVDFIFINCGDSKDVIDAFLKGSDIKYSFPIGYDLSDELCMKFNITAIPTTYILNEKNEVNDVLVGARSGTEYKRYIEKVLN